MRVFLAAGESTGVKVLRRLLDDGLEVVGVAASESAGAGQGAAVARLARSEGLPTWPGSSVRDPSFAKTLRQLRVDLMLNVFTLHIVCREVLDTPTVGAFNLHPGPLPAYAGLNPVSWAVFNGETEHAVTLHRMTDVVDGGAVAREQSFPIHPGDRALDVMLKCAEVGVDCVAGYLETLDGAGVVEERPQDKRLRVARGAGPPNGGAVDWNWEAARIHRFVLACDYAPFRSPWGLPETTAEGTLLGLGRTSLTNETAREPTGTVRIRGHRVWVAARDEWLELELVHLPGGWSDPGEVLSDGIVLGVGGPADRAVSS